MLGDIAEKRLAKHHQSCLTRKRRVTKKGDGNTIIIDGASYVDFSSNDYLCLQKHPKIKACFAKAVEQYGFGSGASAAVSGYSEQHAKVERQFADWLNVDKTILFSSGYLANVSVLSTLANRHSGIASDKLCHASLLDGIQLSRAKHYRYRHADMRHLTTILAEKCVDFIVSESIFSMEGDIAPINQLVDLSKTHQVGLIIDDAHGIGVLGEHGKGSHNEYQLSQLDFTYLILPLGKAFNAMGAIVAGRNEVINTILQFARSYRYTTALPSAVCAAISAALAVVCRADNRRAQLQHNINFFIDYASEKGLALVSNEKTPIKSILVHSAQKALTIQAYLLSKGFYTSVIRPPTVPANTSRLRVSLNACHCHAQIAKLIDEVIKGLVQCQ